jgi:adenine-specific DNA-methyltransferase
LIADSKSCRSQSRYISRASSRTSAGDFPLFGELFRVHRGQVTGANNLWIAGPHSAELPESVLFKSVTRAREIFAADGVLADASQVRSVIDIPPDLNAFNAQEKRSILRFLDKVRAAGGDRSYIAQNRKSWWSVGLREHAPIIATYMARRPPAFAINEVQARHINVVHGLYPRQPLSQKVLQSIVRHLLSANQTTQGRVYAGGLIKFEPREMERIAIPRPDALGS